jgi:hypothetical protein
MGVKMGLFDSLFNRRDREIRELKAALSNEIRKHPKDYAVWMHEPNPGEFGVLLVKLDSNGSMADVWSLGSFQSRKEQGALALEIARDFQIMLSDMVPTSGQGSSAPTSDTLTYNVAETDNQTLQTLPHWHGTIWLEGDEIWFTQPTKEFSYDGCSYRILGGAICFPREKIGRKMLLDMLRKERDVWTVGDEATVMARLIERAQKLRG